MDCCGNRILTIKENLPSCTLIVILFLEQEVEIRTFPPSLPRFSNWKILYGCKNWIRIGCARISGCKVLICTPCSRNRITIKVQLGKFSLIIKNLTTFRPFLASFKRIFKLPCTSAYAKRKLVPGLSVIKVLASFSNSIQCFVNDGLILTSLCLIAFLLM